MLKMNKNIAYQRIAGDVLRLMLLLKMNTFSQMFWRCLSVVCILQMCMMFESYSSPLGQRGSLTFSHSLRLTRTIRARVQKLLTRYVRAHLHIFFYTEKYLDNVVNFKWFCNIFHSFIFPSFHFTETTDVWRRVLWIQGNNAKHFTSRHCQLSKLATNAGVFALHFVELFAYLVVIKFNQVMIY